MPEVSTVPLSAAQSSGGIRLERNPVRTDGGRKLGGLDRAAHSRSIRPRPHRTRSCRAGKTVNDLQTVGTASGSRTAATQPASRIISSSIGRVCLPLRGTGIIPRAHRTEQDLDILAAVSDQQREPIASMKAERTKQIAQPICAFIELATVQQALLSINATRSDGEAAGGRNSPNCRVRDRTRPAPKAFGRTWIFVSAKLSWLQADRSRCTDSDSFCIR
jgi:hypothetical protein